ncbi:MAG: SPOR domain-containing protein [Paludibacteraceae bacterium]|nr:SPOR domain-containing protein [Paludibacteraceae bacterium]
MKKLIAILGMAVALTTVYAQNYTGSSQPKGTVKTHQAAQMDRLLAKGTPQAPSNTDNTLIVSGFRVQLYSSNNAHKAKKDALNLEKDLQVAYPNQQIYVSYQAPFWKVRIGDFSSYFEALAFSRKLKDQFPQYSDEIYIIKEDVVSVSKF